MELQLDQLDPDERLRFTLGNFMLPHARFNNRSWTRSFRSPTRCCQPGRPTIGRTPQCWNLRAIRQMKVACRWSSTTVLQGVGHPQNEQNILETYKKTLARKPKTNRWQDIPNTVDRDRPTLVRLYGYIGNWSQLSKKLAFATLGSPSLDQSIQLISTPNPNEPNELLAHRTLRSIRSNSPVYIEGLLRPKLDSKSDQEVKSFNPDQLEICVSGTDGKVESLNDFPQDIIFTPETQFGPAQRHLQLRNDTHLRQALSLRADIQESFRLLLRAQDMTEIETPLLFKSTSEGAREFIIPTRRRGLAYALPQSPQQFKQLLIASGISGYFQFARCFRDEDLRADRQPEFTQVDIEIAFASGSEVMGLVESSIRLIWQKFLSIELGDAFPRNSYHEAMSMYGSDKPDLRIPFPPFAPVGHMVPVDLVNMLTKLNDPLVDALIVPLGCTPQETRIMIKSLLDSLDGQAFQANPDGAPGIFVYDTAKPLNGLAAFGFEAVENLEREFSLENGDLIVLQARPNVAHTGGSTALGDFRKAIFQAAIIGGHIIAPSWSEFKPLWITDFPLFSPVNAGEPGQGGQAGISATHHPFTSPKRPEDVEVLSSEPLKALGDHYDLVINGEEIGGGSRRIHQAAMQELVFRKILSMEENKVAEFSHLLEALRAGCPPHAGIALGFDRLVAMITSSKFGRAFSMRDVIAFPKSGKGDDVMVHSPGALTEQALNTYHLALRNT